MNVCSLDISLNPAEKLAWLIPQWNSTLNINECRLDVGAKGLVHQATRSGAIKKVLPQIVRENDSFAWHDAETKPDHIFDPFSTSRGEIIGAYTVATLTDNSRLVHAVSLERINKSRAAAATDYVWRDNFEAMSLKTAIKLAAKYWPARSKHLDETIEMLNESEGLAKTMKLEVAEKLTAELSNMGLLENILGKLNVSALCDATPQDVPRIQNYIEGIAKKREEREAQLQERADAPGKLKARVESASDRMVLAKLCEEIEKAGLAASREVKGELRDLYKQAIIKMKGMPNA